MIDHFQPSKSPAPQVADAHRRIDRTEVVEPGTYEGLPPLERPLDLVQGSWRGWRPRRDGQRSVLYGLRGDGVLSRTRDPERPGRWEIDAGVSLSGGPIGTDGREDSSDVSGTDAGETFPPPYFSIVNIGRSRRY